MDGGWQMMGPPMAEPASLAIAWDFLHTLKVLRVCADVLLSADSTVRGIHEPA
jgi:hypothetical protein